MEVQNGPVGFHKGPMGMHAGSHLSSRELMYSSEAKMMYRLMCSFGGRDDERNHVFFEPFYDVFFHFLAKN